MSLFINERIADAEVISNLRKHIKQLERKLMSKIIVAKDGTVYRVHEFEILNEAEISDLRNRLQTELADLNTTVADASVTPVDNISAQETVNQPVDGGIAAVQTDAQPQPVLADEAPTAPVVLQ